MGLPEFTASKDSRTLGSIVSAADSSEPRWEERTKGEGKINPSS